MKMLVSPKPKQHKPIVSYMTDNDTSIVLPTGYDKSLIYTIFYNRNHCIL